MSVIARVATAASVAAAFLTSCDIAVGAPWYWPAAEAATAVILAGVSAWVRTTNPNTDDKDAR